ncbi:hypothetical protein RvVAR031_31520 [Agrobacterium vitis]|nr:hypothetical protein RvVAR031_31520 [Agrobacterium vitis]
MPVENQLHEHSPSDALRLAGPFRQKPQAYDKKGKYRQSLILGAE